MSRDSSIPRKSISSTTGAAIPTIATMSNRSTRVVVSSVSDATSCWGAPSGNSHWSSGAVSRTTAICRPKPAGIPHQSLSSRSRPKSFLKLPVPFRTDRYHIASKFPPACPANDAVNATTFSSGPMKTSTAPVVMNAPTIPARKTPSAWGKFHSTFWR